MSSPLSLYEPLDIIGNGSFGIIRKVRRKADGVVFARKELNFERMTERDRKQIVSEVNILKDLHHEHIVRYHDRYVDREAGILYILMEYCGGGDLSVVIKQSQRHNRPIPEDTIWNYFMQILLALNHCHHPHGHGRSSSSGSSTEFEGKGEKRAQILHRDLKPDNVFLDDNNTVKLGDFGLSKALAQASFANTYVGTPYYMSPELMQEKAYDSKSDIWSLGCLIYELCALKPPFHEAKTHSELSILIRNGRIPPLPKGYSPALSGIIKAMLNLNPAMRPSAAQLLQHERLDLAFKVSETQKMLTTVKGHKATMLAKERELTAREVVLNEKERRLAGMLALKDSEIASLHAMIATAEAKHVERVRAAIAARDEELREMVLKQEAAVATRIARREEEIMEAVRQREAEIARMWADWERESREGMARAVEERMLWVQQQAEELERERGRLDDVRVELQRKMDEMNDVRTTHDAPYKGKTPLEEVKNLMAPLARLAEPLEQQTPTRAPSYPPVFETPLNRATNPKPSVADIVPPSAMKGVILTATGEPVATPSPAELAKLFIDTPKVRLNFTKIFDFESEAEDDEDTEVEEDSFEGVPSSASSNATTTKQIDPAEETTPKQTKISPKPPPTRLRRPSIRTTSQRSSAAAEASTKASTSAAVPPAETTRPKIRKLSSVPVPSTVSSAKLTNGSQPISQAEITPGYDLSDEENLPSPFLKKIDRDRMARTASAPGPPPIANPTIVRAAPRKSGGLRTMAVVNAANAANTTSRRATTLGRTSSSTALNRDASLRPALAKAQRAGEEARKALFRP